MHFVLLIVAGIAVAGGVTMGLWNWLTPTLFGWPSISYLQALGLLVLTRLLFGGLRHHGFGHHCRLPVESMSEEERAQLRERLHRCGFGRRWLKCRNGEAKDDEPKAES
ncbi:hypothetical protein [Endothiovibrio diazotrophicus]